MIYLQIIANFTIYIGLAVAIYSFLVILVGIYLKKDKLINSGKSGALSILIVSGLSTIILLFLLGTSQFQFEYVANHTNYELALIYKLTALWAGNEGSLLIWAFLLALFNVVIIYSKKLKNNPLAPYINLIMLLNIIFFYFVIVMTANPFELLSYTAQDGYGLNPMLWDFGMIIHPIAIYLGYVSLAVPFAISIAALILKFDNSWINLTRRWALFSWLFLSIGNLVGARWSYTELGWGGYWAWDPVENASLLPWLTLTAYLHSIMLQEKKNMFKLWNHSLLIVSYLLTIFGTYLVRSGVLASVHAFSNSSMGKMFLIFLLVITIIAFGILAKSYPVLKIERLSIDSLNPKETTFLINNLLFAGSTFAVLWGTIFPILSKAIRNTKVYVGTTYYNTIMAPFMLGIILLMGFNILINWNSTKYPWRSYKKPLILSLLFILFLFLIGVDQFYPLLSFGIVFFLTYTHLVTFYKDLMASKRSSSKTIFSEIKNLLFRNNRRYGGYIIHIGIGLLAIGVIGSQNYDSQVMKTLTQGEAIEIKDYKLVYTELEKITKEGNDIVIAKFDLFKDDNYISSLQSEKRFHKDWYEPSTKVGLYSTLMEDIFVVLSSWSDDGKATFVIKYSPLVIWIWVGGVVMMIGAILAMKRNKVLT